MSADQTLNAAMNDQEFLNKDQVKTLPHIAIRQDPPTPSPDEVIMDLKLYRVELDAKLQGMKELQRRNVPLIGRSLALSITHLEDSIMRLGMCLKDLNTPNPYPNSSNPTNTIIEPTADGLKL